ncbi:MAG: hypothetical protein QF614_04090, partial [SAR324 cluster bacterium]|nr:hypothetical protein [SAR324 cluster bacterium]
SAEHCQRVRAAGGRRAGGIKPAGIGKTAIAFLIAWKLFHSRWILSDWRAGLANASWSFVRSAISFPVFVKNPHGSKSPSPMGRRAR